MKKFTTLAALSAALYLLVIGLSTTVIAAEKVTICHVPPGNPDNAHTITISRNALKAHLGENGQGLHGGDYYGPCQTSKPSATPSSTPSSTPSPEPTAPPTASPTPTCDLPEGCEPTPTASIDVPLGGTPKPTLPPTDTE